MGGISGDEKPADMLAIVYALEEGMRSFYEELGRRTDDAALQTLFAKLSELEVEHKDKLIALYNARFEGEATAETLDAKVSGDLMEGGTTTSDLLERASLDGRSAADVLAFAMSLEAQALDLYLRYAQRSADAETKALLHALADEEKAHLAALGELLEREGR